ncbi:MAG: pyridoxamine 5'-phosphate oxidase family protein [Desulfovibrio sp.]|uniref:pyridoxamine 5'-phosphate oxidase family protein n=1 Tax=Desulfovibrio sp. TaxID=885 RepID=UPI0025B8C012|nr:pyridoxamine 5'-phosphate oxidase family protein [Desulfovibrio sp.]MCI7569819.1 pyridoxamine 5'-phosphate oxidase family protein [Desulfovibrio sp.]
MRRKDREMPADFARMVLDKSLWVTLAMLDPDGHPYAVPVSIVREGDNIYFHAAKAGRKTRCLKNRPRVCLVAVGDARPVARHFTMEFSSAVVHGTAQEVVETEEKIHALRLLCLRYAGENMSNFEEAVERSLSRTAIWKISIDELSGKRKKYDADGTELTFAAGWPEQDAAGQKN